MVFAFFSLNAQKYGFFENYTRANLWSGNRLAFVVFLSFIGIGGYTAFTLTCRNKPECNEVHSYIAFVPVSLRTSLNSYNNLVGMQSLRTISVFDS